MNGEEIYKRIMVMESIKAATTFMKNSDISKSDLVKMCKKHDIFIAPKATKEEMIDRFVSSTLGVKLKKKVANRFKTK
jgi:hypothetical protein